MKLAVDAATDTAEPLAWTHVQLGKLYFNHGRFRAAEREFGSRTRSSRTTRTGSTRSRSTRRRSAGPARALALERRAVDLIPLPQYVAALGDLYAATGHPALARRQYATIGVIERLLRANGVRVDLEIAQFDVDHGIRLQPRARARARSATGSGRRSTATTCSRGRSRGTAGAATALGYSRQRAQPRHAGRVKFFHRGMIERCLGRAAVARRGSGARSR